MTKRTETETETLAALEHAAQLLDVARVVFRDAGNHDAANLLSAASKRAWAAILKARTE
jgi:hypothetical protein